MHNSSLLNLQKSITIQSLFEEQAQKVPKNTAIIFNDTALSYKELNQRANKLANFIKQQHKIKPDTLVMLCLDKSHHTLIAILAVLKSGGAYVPIDPNYPDERIQYLLEDTDSHIMLTNCVHKKRFKNLSNKISIYTIDGIDFQNQLSFCSESNPITKVSDSNLAYVIYTSGTTGKPKGVMIEHRSFISIIKSIKNKYFFNKSHLKTYSITNYVFDIFGLEYGATLLTGGALTIGSNNFNSLDCSSFDFIQMTPSLCEIKIDNLVNTTDLTLLVGGESLNSKLLLKILNKSIHVINVYGPTETTIWSISKLYNYQKNNIETQVELGEVFENEKSYVVDGNNELVAVGEVGELCIGGIGLARGYLNRPDLTSEKFRDNYFQHLEDKKYSKLYRTGDLVRVLPGNAIEYVGRNDFQVKIRGHRIELGEIECVLASFDGVKQNVVIAKDHLNSSGHTTGSKYLVAYYVKSLEIGKAENDEFVQTWEDIYQLQYSSLDINHFKQNIAIWNSSYTGQEIGKEEMLEWVNSTTSRINQLNPKKVIEIGSGSGLILFNLIDNCEHYLATDFTENSISYTDKVINKFGYEKKVSLLCCSADEVPYDRLEQNYDTVIINSVVQYFPNIEYLESVISKVASNLDNLAQLFIGDVRDYRLLDCFHHSVQKFKMVSTTKEDVSYFSERDKELLISPLYFLKLQARYTNISHVEILPRLGEADNEMNNYRYDVIIHFNKNMQIDALVINEEDFIETRNIEQYINENQKTDYFCIKYPNKRILRDYFDYNKTFQLSTIDEQYYLGILGINEIIRGAKSKKYQVKFLLDINNPLYFNIIFYKDKKKSFYINYKSQNQSIELNLYNNPLLSSKIREQKFIEEIKKYLSELLPEYMLPEHYIALESLPLTINGKLDRKALPSPQLISNNEYVAPSNDNESRMCKLWSELLGMEENQVGVNDDFFSLGGNSILAMKLASILNNDNTTSFDTSLLFKYKTIESFTKNAITNHKHNILIDQKQSQNFEEQSLSFAQERLWFIEKYEGGSNAYNIPMFFELPNNIKIELLEKSIEQIVERHEILKTLIVEDIDGNSYQHISDLKDKPLKLQQITVSCEDDLNKELSDDANHIYELSSEYPIRLAVYKLIEEDSQSRYLSIVIHHIAFDGWSIGVFFNELKECYAYNLAKSQDIEVELSLPEISIQYKDFAIWQRNYLKGNKLQEQIEYWSQKLEGFEPLNLITDYTRPKEVSYFGADIFFSLDLDTSNKLRSLAKDLKVSVYTLLLSGYYLMLRIYSHQDDLVLGTSIANRHYSQIENLIGFFVNSLALRIKVDTKLTIKEFIHQVGNEIIGAHLHQDLPFEKLVDELDVEKDVSRHPIFQVMFEMDGFGVDHISEFLENYRPKIDVYNVAKFDLNTSIDDSNPKIKGVFNYSTNLYDKETIEGYIETYTHILNQFAAMSADKNFSTFVLSDLTYLTPPKYQQIVYEWNNVVEDYPAESVVASFEKQVESTPNNIAIVAEDRWLTYEELNSKVNKLAHYLKKNYKTNPDALVMIVMERDIEFLILMLAVFKVGMAYVPIDPVVPADRIKSIFNESSPSIIFANKKYKSLLNTLDLSSANLCIFDDLRLDEYDSSNLCLDISPNSLAYVIYTSGSTGRPKGAMIEHKGMLNHLYTKISDMNMTAGDKVAQTASQNFDISVWQFISALLVGGTTVVFKDISAWAPEQLLKTMEQDEITIFQTVPSHMYAILQIIENDTKQSNKFDSLRWLIINGEPLSSEICDRWFDLNAKIPIINAYGYTESSDDITHFKIFSKINEKPPKIMPISGTLANSRVYITDSDLNPVPIGAVGEVIAGGVGIGRGYLNRPELTAERYVPDVFTENADGYKLYHSGDLARYVSGGVIEYVGRKDFQVKVRGYRIELEEIESVLGLYIGVSQSVVLACDGVHGKYLVGYYVADFALDHLDIIRHLSSKLPEYMVPEHFVHLTELPLNINGKLDRKQLQAPELIDVDSYVEPRSEMEAKVCAIWSELLGFEALRVGINEDFFKLGGDSIVSIQLVSRLRQKLGLSVSVKDIFTYRNIQMLYDNVLSKSVDNVVVKSEQRVLSGDVALLPIQRWFFTQQFERPDHWNQSFMVRVPKLDVVKLQNAVGKLHEQHDAFRLRYKDMVQYYDPNAESVALKTLDVSSFNADELGAVLTDWQSGFNLEQGDIYSIGYLHGYADGSSRIYIACHHLAIDTVSWRILVEDLQSLYNGKALPSKGSSYRQWTSVIDHYAEEHKTERGYWESILSDYSADKLEQLVVGNGNNQSCVELDQHLTKQLLQESSATYNTEINDLLLAALSHGLSELTGQRSNHIVLEGHGREELDLAIDVSRTIGWFTSMYPVCLEADGDIATSIKQTKEMLRQVPNKGVGYGALIGYSEQHLPLVSFNYLGQFDSKEQQSWSITDDASGVDIAPANKDRHILNINGLVVDGILRFTIDSKLSKEDTEHFAQLFQDRLTKIIEHTSTQDRSYLTASDVDNIISAEYLDAIQQDKEVEFVYLANSLQQGFIYHSLNQGDVDDAYLVQLIWHYNNELDIEKLQQAWIYAQSKFIALRLRFAWDDELVQIIDGQGAVDWRYIDLSDKSDAESEVNSIQAHDRLESYDLAKGNLFRIYLIKQKDNLYTCIFSNHHAILDGWSNPILLGYVHDTYQALCDGNAVDKSADYSYGYAQKYLQKHRDQHANYWQNYIAQIEDKGDLNGLLSADAKANNIRIDQYNHIKQPSKESLLVTGKLYDQLKSLSQKEGVTLNAICQYIWHKILSVYGGSNQTVVGTIVSGRNIAVDNIERSVGLHINTVPLIVDHNNNETVIHNIKEIQEDINDINSKSNIALSSLQQQGQRLFNNLFVFENYPDQASNNDNLRITFKEGMEKLDYPLGVLAEEANNELEFTLQYARELFDPKTIRELLQLAEHLLQQIVSDTNPNIKTKDLTYLNKNQYKQIVERWNDNAAEYPEDKTIDQLFTQQVEKTPNNIAITYKGESLTYAELNKQANQLAHYIKEQYQIKPNDLVALCLDRSHYSLIAILAVLKSGGAYVPIDPSYPIDRIEYILQDTKAKLVITDENNKDSINNNKTLTIDNKKTKQILQNQPTTTPKTTTTSTDLAYIIYTSGTTGNPKGVMIGHKGVVSLKYALTEQYQLGLNGESESILLFANYVFDASVEQMVLALLNGYKLVIADNELLLDTSVFIEYLNHNKITHIHAPPIILERYDFRDIPTLRRIISGGDRLTEDIYSKIKSASNDVEIINEYGPTETTITSIVNFVKDDDLSIGKPVSNISTYILDDNLNPVPEYAIGEMYIGGVGVARGYLNLPDLTDEKFIDNPFNTKEKIYRTGDLARYVFGGVIEYVGRKDFQVKVRGYRIELEEIESVLGLYIGVSQSVVLACDGVHGKYLVGYYVADFALDHLDIIRHLSSKLPEYMVPEHFVHLTELPLNINGKLDRKQLQAPELIDVDSYVEPRSEMEAKVCAIWSELLGFEALRVGINEDFFKLGGDSIVSIQLVSRLRQKLGLSVSVKDIFTYRNIQMLYDNVLSKSVDNVVVKSEQRVLSGDVALLPIQRWFFTQQFERPDHWNQSFMVRVPKLDVVKLQNAVGKLHEQHDAFRLRYKDMVQYYDPNAESVALKTLDVSSFNADELGAVLTDWQSGFNLEQGDIYSIGYLHGYADGSSRIYIACHHLAIDTVSWRILVEDLQSLYNGKALPSKGSSYRQWTSVIDHYAEEHKTERGYWESILSDYSADKLEQLVVGNGNNQSCVELDQHLTKQLLQESSATYNTEINDLLLAALSHGLSELTGQRSNHIVLEGHGREELDLAIDVSRTIGWFTSMYPVCLEADGDIATSIKQTKEMLRQVPNKGVGYGALIGYSEQHLPLVSFNYLGQFDSKEQQSWSITDDASGVDIAPANKDRHILNINGLVVDGILRFTIDSKLSKEDTEHFAQLFQDRLTKIIEHTSTQDRSYLTASDVDNIISAEYLDAIQQDKEVEFVYLANSLQQGFIYHSLNQGDVDDAYLVQLIWHYNNELDIEKLQQAWIYAQSKFIALRLRFAWDDELVQIIDGQGAVDWRYIDLSDKSDAESEVNSIQAHDRLESYDLAKGNLFRIYLIKQKDNLYTCIFSNHHAILDGWSNPILLGYVHDTYQALCDGNAVDKSADYSYGYAQKYLQKHRDQHANYWQNYIAQIEDKGDLNGLLSADAKANNIRIDQYNHIKQPSKESLLVTGKLYDQLKSLSQKEGVTLNAICQYIWHKILSVYGGSNQTVVGTIVSGRNIAVDNIERSVGLHINTVPLIVDHNNNETVIHNIKEIQEDINDINSKSNIALSSLQQQGQRLFNNLFVFENYPDQASNNDNLRITFKEGMEKLDYPLGVLAEEANNELEFTLQYARELFDPKTIRELLQLAEHLLQQIVSDTNPNIKTKDLTYLNKNQYKQIVERWNDNAAEYPEDKTIDQLFTQQVEKTPNNIAITYKGESLTYAELNKQANQLAHYIKEQYQIKPNDLVALCLDRSHYSLIAILAVLKSGGAYVPIDPSYPIDRIEYILQDTKAKLVITDENNKDSINNNKTLTIDNKKTKQILQNQPTTTPKTTTTSTDLAYIIYTSGTTGNPKGVMIGHKGVVNYIFNIHSSIKLAQNDRVDYSTSLGFDLTVTTTICSLCLGSQIIVYGADVRDIELYIDHLIKNKVSFIKITPSYFELLIDIIPSTSINKIIVGGEKFNHEILDKLSKIENSNLAIYDEYGPTEATVGTCIAQIFPDNNTTIGRPYNNNKVYVLNNSFKYLPTASIGELYIGGVGLALGYLNNTELTAEKFISSPFDSSEKLYKTGDLVRYLVDGQLEYIGRSDSQVKLQGYRIELEEIEKALISSVQEIKQAFIMVEEKPNKYLTAYYVSESECNEQDIIKFLTQKLPDYMVPKLFIHLTKLPLNVNGKVDKTRLPLRESNRGVNYIAPRNEVESQICILYSDLLQIAFAQISIEESFFRLGGNSILAIKLVSKINKLYSSNLRVVDIFTHTNVKELTLRIAQIKNIYQAIVKLNHARELPQLFMIHPGAGGCEVYASLAAKLANNFSCYGVDSYNLYNQNKITDLTDLARYYLEHIDQMMRDSEQNEYHLLGWSLGGQIALEIAYILEQRGDKKIKLYLLDVVLDDDHLMLLRRDLDLKQLQLDYLEYAQKHKHDKSYTEKIIKNIHTESKLVKKQIDYLNLSNTDILLFKAELQDTTSKINNFKCIYKYSTTLEYNNIDKIIKNQSKINLIKLMNSSHGDALKEEELLISKIIEHHNSQKNVVTRRS
jgi:amino acid adenylation domain-containing protein/non-ribosomal peptide synthase protein (TIGR01720 family)